MIYQLRETSYYVVLCKKCGNGSEKAFSDTPLTACQIRNAIYGNSLLLRSLAPLIKYKFLFFTPVPVTSFNFKQMNFKNVLVQS